MTFNLPLFRGCLRLLLLVVLTCESALCRQPQNADASAPDGGALYLQNCIKCHGTVGQGVSAVVSIAGPSLEAEHDRQRVVDIVRHGTGMMPSFEPLLSQQQIDAVAAYVTQQLATIPLAEGNLSEGGMLFRVNCAPCHGTAARGGAMAFAGVNAPSLADKSAAVIAGTIRWGPGPMPSFPPPAISDQELNSIVTYVVFLQHPPNPGGAPMNYYGSVAEGLVAWIAVILLVATTGWIERRGKG